ncbi:uncharacterized protein LOC127010768 [Drosophila biarmipes]|uniref:uncharacterized protein LOC127010768 n=1 Tax=Drosophila biarmipes TaxID=125945 RepID=UPI0021CCCA66|nr:uncharacterized protein LOC127010768 [Drosophila biarmipes]
MRSSRKTTPTRQGKSERKGVPKLREVEKTQSSRKLEENGGQSLTFANAAHGIRSASSGLLQTRRTGSEVRAVDSSKRGARDQKCEQRTLANAAVGIRSASRGLWQRRVCRPRTSAGAPGFRRVCVRESETGGSPHSGNGPEFSRFCCKT